VIPELRHLQVSLGAQLSYRKAADLLRMFLPPVGGTTHTTARSRVIAVGERIDEEIRQEITENRKPDKAAEQMIKTTAFYDLSTVRAADMLKRRLKQAG
jgi:hypothetical protein